MADESSSDARVPDYGFRDVAAALAGGVTNGDPNVRSVPAWANRALAWATGGVAVLFLVPAIFVAVVLPYRYWDSLAFGSWSRSIAEGHGLWENASVFALSRPVFYVPQGIAWRYLDEGDWVGRLYSLSFAIALCIAVWLLAGLLSDWRAAAPITRSLSIGLLLGSAVFAGLVAAGMTDIPVAAGSAATAVVLWRTPTKWLVLIAALLAALTVLAKASGLIALAGLVAAAFVLLADVPCPAPLEWGSASALRSYTTRGRRRGSGARLRTS